MEATVASHWQPSCQVAELHMKPCIYTVFHYWLNTTHLCTERQGILLFGNRVKDVNINTCLSFKE